MLHKVEPLRNELKKLEHTAEDNKKRAEEVNNVITQLEKSIAAYKEEYALLISQAQAIKSDLAAVQSKVYYRKKFFFVLRLFFLPFVVKLQ